jgi:alpha-tubulin suppressor-like RCC1 family protein/ankyrin repeat protein
MCSKRKIRLIISLMVAICVIMTCISSVAWAKKKVVKTKPKVTANKKVISNIKVEGGSGISLAVMTDGSVWRWGGGTPDNPQPLPRKISFLSNIKDVKARGGMYYVLTKAGDVYWWSDGNNYLTKINGLLNIVSMDAFSGNLGVFVKKDGTVWLWGGSSFLGKWYPKPVKVKGLSNVVDVSIGQSPACFIYAITKDGKVFGWGNNQYGQLGSGNKQIDQPTEIKSLKGVRDIVCGEDFMMALNKNGTVWWMGKCWGKDSQVNKPSQIKGLSNVISITTSNYHALSLTKEGNIWAWGRSNRYGQIGDGTFIERLNPVKLTGINNIIAIGSGEDHSLAVRNDGTVWAWGNNSLGQVSATNLYKMVASPTKVKFMQEKDKSIVVEERNLRLTKAVEQGNLSLVKSLLNQGADPDALSLFGDTALNIAVQTGREDMVNVLLKGGADPNLGSVNGGFPLLNASRDKIGIVKILLNAGASLKFHDGITPLMTSGTVEIAKLFLEYGIDPNSADVEGQTALMYADNGDIANVLIKAGSKINAQDAEGRTVLMWAAFAWDSNQAQENLKYVQVTETLLSYKADPNIRDKNGKTALTYWKENKYAHPKLGELLKAAGAVE